MPRDSARSSQWRMRRLRLDHVEPPVARNTTRVGYDMHSLADDPSRLGLQRDPAQRRASPMPLPSACHRYFADPGITCVQRSITHHGWGVLALAARGGRQRHIVRMFIRPHRPWQTSKASASIGPCRPSGASRQIFTSNSDQPPMRPASSTTTLGGLPPLSRL